VAIVCGVVAWRAVWAERRRSAARVAALASAIGGGDDAPDGASDGAVPVASLFEQSSGTGRPIAQVAAMIILAIVLTSLTIALRRQGTEAATPEPAAAQQEHGMLELVSMRHVRRQGVFVVTGLVRNPPGGMPLSGVDAMVLAFDRNGDFLSSSSAALDLPALRPGEESPFAVTLQEAAGVGRYRVSFRTSQGLLRHVDLRGRQIAMVKP
jgi:hypothetical protein